MSFPQFRRLVIYGVGLLGGSLGLAVKKGGMAVRVTGLGRSLERLEQARQLGAVDECHSDPVKALRDADALVLAVPPRLIREELANLAPLISGGCFVTDIGSVKAGIVSQAERVLAPDTLFIGSHPMAGSEKTGVEHARSDFYEGHACILTPTPGTSPEALSIASGLWRGLGCRLIVATPERHDSLLAGISHLPHLIASALMQTLDRQLASPAELASIASGGLRDTTRIAASDPEMWEQIFAENRSALLGSLDSMLATLHAWREVLNQPQPDQLAIVRFLTEGRQTRRLLDVSQ